MPLSNRRRARRKEIQLQETSDVEAPDSSPSRPANKKRKVCGKERERKKKEMVKVVVDGELTCDRSIESRRNLEP